MPEPTRQSDELTLDVLEKATSGWTVTETAKATGLSRGAVTSRVRKVIQADLDYAGSEAASYWLNKRMWSN